MLAVAEGPCGGCPVEEGLEKVVGGAGGEGVGVEELGGGVEGVEGGHLFVVVGGVGLVVWLVVVVLGFGFLLVVSGVLGGRVDGV